MTLTESEIFNMLPLSDKQKAELFHALTSARHTEQKHPRQSPPRPSEPVDRLQAADLSQSPDVVQECQPQQAKPETSEVSQQSYNASQNLGKVCTSVDECQI